MSADSIHAVRSAAAVLKDTSNVAPAAPDAARAARPAKGRKGAAVVASSTAPRPAPAVRRPRAPATPAKARDSGASLHAAKDGAAATPGKGAKKGEPEKGAGSPAVVRAAAGPAAPRPRPQSLLAAAPSGAPAAAPAAVQHARSAAAPVRGAPLRQAQPPQPAALPAQHPMLDPLAQLHPQALQEIVRQVLLRSYRGPLMPAAAAANIDAALAMGHGVVAGTPSIVDARLGSAEHQDLLDPSTNVYINGLPSHTSDDDLLRLGSCFGKVTSHKAIINAETGLCKGYGFLMYSTTEEATWALAQIASYGLQTSWARESFSSKLRRMADHDSANVYLSNLPLDMNSSALEQLFAPHFVVSLRILTDNDGVSRGVGFVRLRDRDIAQECIDRLHGKILPGTSTPLQVRFADSEAQKRLKQTTANARQTGGVASGDAASPKLPGSGIAPTPTAGALADNSQAAAVAAAATAAMFTSPHLVGGAGIFAPYAFGSRNTSPFLGGSPGMSTPSLSPASTQSSVFGSPPLGYGASPDSLAYVNYLQNSMHGNAALLGRSASFDAATHGFGGPFGLYNGGMPFGPAGLGLGGAGLGLSGIDKAQLGGANSKSGDASAVYRTGAAAPAGFHSPYMASSALSDQRRGSITAAPKSGSAAALFVPNELAAQHASALSAATKQHGATRVSTPAGQSSSELAPIHLELGNDGTPVRMYRSPAAASAKPAAVAAVVTRPSPPATAASGASSDAEGPAAPPAPALSQSEPVSSAAAA